MTRPDGLNAITLLVTDMAASCAFYETIGFEVAFGGPTAAFTSYRAGRGTFLNLDLVDDDPQTRWGRVIFHVDDVDAAHASFEAAGHTPTMAPSDAPWGERYFHIDDPDGHEISFARPLGRDPGDPPSSAN